MSSEQKKSSRFGMLKGVRESAQGEPSAPVVPPAPAIPMKDDSLQEPFSCTLSRGMKRRIKKASADEDRKQYKLIEQALEEYLSKYHPDIK